MRFAIFCVLLLFLFSCARTPPAKTSERIVDHYFYKYGRKFKTSDFGLHKIDNVRILDIEEVHKHLAAVTAEVVLREGPSYLLRCMLQKKTLGWRLVSWERL